MLMGKKMMWMAEKRTEEKKENAQKLSIREMIRQATVYLFVIAVSIVFIFVLFKWSEIHKAAGGLIKILSPVIAGLIIAYILLPIVEFVERRLSKLRWVVRSKKKLKRSGWSGEYPWPVPWPLRWELSLFWAIWSFPSW